MTAPWQRVREVFEAVVDLDSSRAEARIHEIEQHEPEVAAEVRSLLDHHSRAGRFMEAPAAALEPEGEEAVPELEAGQTIGTYRVEREIGRGGMGRVFLATDTRLHRRVALKMLPRTIADHPSQRERLKREARAAAQLSHPGICTVHALEEIDDRIVVVSEYVDGRSLRDDISSRRHHAAADIWQTAVELSDALAAAHDRGITHRDLKPENIMRGGDGRLKVLDFGLALVEPSLPEDAGAHPRLTIAGTLLGTPAYMAPEQLRGEGADARSDVFALGVVLYELAAGAHPFEAPTPLATAARVLETAPTPLSSIRSDLAPALAAAIDRALSKLPADRFASAGAFRRTLKVDAVPGRPAGTGVAVWWRRHQLTAIVLYLLASLSAWQVKEWTAGIPRLLFPFVGILAVVGAVFRGHLTFAEQMNRASFAGERQRARPVTALIDVTIGAALVVDGLVVHAVHEVWSLLIMGLGIGIVLARLLVEPATSRGAFDESR